MTPINALLIGAGGFALGVVITNLVELRKPDEVTVLVTEHEQLERLDRMAGRDDD